MASNSTSPPSPGSSEADDETGPNEQPQKTAEESEKHPFSEPWEDSDLILEVEDKKFHVHRQILSIQSPVFKAMLNSQFKEATATEIPLPGKKADEVLDFLKQFYLKEREGITLNKMSHLLKLADEYQAQGILDLCVNSLQVAATSEASAVKILFLATDTVMAREDDRLDDVREECYDLIKDMNLADITGMSDFKNLNQDSLKSVFVERIGRLETFIKEVRPQLVGLVEYCLYLKLAAQQDVEFYGKTRISRCPEHFPNTSTHKAKVDLLQRIKSCSVCRKMIIQLVSSSTHSTNKEHFYGGNIHFDQKLVSLLLDL